MAAPGLRPAARPQVPVQRRFLPFFFALDFFWAAEAESEGGARRQTPRVGIHSLLTRDSDAVARPGFRNPLSLIHI